MAARIVNYSNWRTPDGGTVLNLAREDELRGGNVLNGGPFLVDADDPTLAYLLTLHVAVEAGRPVCEALTVRRRKGGKRVTTAALRFPLDDYVRGAIAVHPWLSREGERRGDRIGYIPATGEDRALTFLGLDEVIGTYRRMLANPSTRWRATALTADTVHRSRGYVSNLLSRARREGLLGDDEIGSGGQPAQTRRVGRARRKDSRR